MDQAEGLRELARKGAFEQMGLPAIFDHAPGVDYAKLWGDLKALLESQIKTNARPGVGVLGKSVAQDVLIHMLKAETEAAKPGHQGKTASIFDLKGDSHA